MKNRNSLKSPAFIHYHLQKQVCILFESMNGTRARLDVIESRTKRKRKALPREDATRLPH